MNAHLSANQNQLTNILVNLNKIVSAGVNLQKPLSQAAVILTQEIKENFDRQGAIYQGGGFSRSSGAFARGSGATTKSSAWKPLALSTRSQREELGFNGARPILVRTGRLKNGFKVKRITNDQLVIENNVPYAATHQNGTSKIPQRKIAGFTVKSKAAIGVLIFNHIFGHIKSFK